jgi:hypothetical protein
MKSTSKHDLYNREYCLGGLAACTVNLYSRLLDFSYTLTFKKELKNYEKEFDDPDDKPIIDLDFFLGINDPAVKLSMQCVNLLLSFFNGLVLRHGIDAEDCVHDYNIEADRYAPMTRIIGKRNSYRKVRQYFEHYVEQLSYTLYYYACALSVNSYGIPVQMRVGIDFSSTRSFRLLNVDDFEVASLIDVINEIETTRKQFYLKLKK